MRWFLLSIVLLVGAAHSQQHRQDEKRPSNREQEGTQKKPFIVKIAPTPKTKAETQQEKEERDAKQRAEELKQKTDTDLVKFTGQLADYTWLLFCVGAFQIAIFVAQLIFIWRQETSTKTIE